MTPAKHNTASATTSPVRWIASLVMVLCAAGTFALVFNRASAESARAIPAPASAEAKSNEAMEVAVIAGGCFWGIQGVYQSVDGVISAESGYAGGEKATANYNAVSRGTSGHAEAVKITFDPRRISYGRILQILFSVAHDPTQLNRQGPDVGIQYRSAIFPQNAEQARIAKEYIGQLDREHVFDAAIVTRIETDRPFYPAEAYHQDFMFKYPTHPYIRAHDMPKLTDLKRIFPELYRTEPRLLLANADPTK